MSSTRGQWPQVTLVDLDPHLAQCQGSHPVMYWHQSHQLSPFKSIAPRQAAFTHDFAEILRRLFLLWRHNFVTWPDPTKFFSPKVAQRMLHKLWKISARSSKRCGVQIRKTHGGVASTPPLTGRGLKGNTHHPKKIYLNGVAKKYVGTTEHVCALVKQRGIPQYYCWME